MNSLSGPSRAVAERFTQAWQSGPGPSMMPPDLETYLAQGPVADRLMLFQTLLRIDLEQRLRRGLMPSIRYYLKCFPEYSEEIRTTFNAPFVMDRLGRGGMGEVYRAFDFVGRRPMAIKKIRTLATPDASTDGEVSLQRFYAEARAAAGLHHPNIVQTYSVGHADGAPYLCMELVEGGSLSARVKEGPRKPREAAALVEALAHGVQHAHEHGIIHRDLKPANVLLTLDGVPKVTDFGLAKLSDDSFGLTHTGAVMGTPEYMAPEQADGRTHEISPATDVWALGGILYALLTGRPPFRAEGREDVRALLRKVCHAAPVPPRSLNPAVPTELEVICLKCLEKLPADRYASARELADDLHRFLDDEPIHARPIPLAGRVWRWSAKNRAITAAAVALVLLLPTTVLFAGLTWILFRAYGAAQGDVALTGEAKVVAEIDAVQERADNLLEQARKADTSPPALDRITESAALRTKTQELLAHLSNPSPDFVARQQSLWQQRWVELRNEATLRLTRTDLRTIRTVHVSGPVNEEHQLGGAVSPDGSWFVFGYAWHHRLHVVRRDTGDVRDIVFPRALPKPMNFLGGAGRLGLAISPEGGRIAVLYPLADELIVVGSNGEDFRTFPLHRGMGRTSSILGDALRFTAEDVIELEDVGGPWSLSISEGKWNLPPAGRPFVRPGLGPQPSKRTLNNGDRFVEHDFTLGQVLTGVENGSPRLLWKDAAGAAGDPNGERCLDVCLGADPRHVYLLTTKRLLFVDAVTGTRADVNLGPSSNTVQRSILFPSRDGVALLRQMPGDRLEVAFLSGHLAQIPIPALGHPAPVRTLDLAPDGLLVTGADRLVHVWKGREYQRVQGAARSETAPVEGIGRPTAQGLFPWWGFAPGPRSRLVIERREPPPQDVFFPGHTELTRTDVHDSDDGRLLHTFPARGVGRIVRIGGPYPQSIGVSSDRRFAVVVAAENGANADLEVWSLDECKPTVRLGSHTLTHNGTTPALGLMFSPRGRWLLTAARPPGGAVLLGQTAVCTVACWRLSDGKRTGEVAFPVRGAGAMDQFGLLFDDEERQVLLTEKGFGSEETVNGSSAWVIDLETGRKRCALDDFETTGSGSQLIVAGDSVVTRSRSRFQALPEPGKPIGREVLPCQRWSLQTGKRTQLGEGWGVAPMIEMSPDGQRALLHGTLKAPDGGFGGIVSRALDVQLWDLKEGKLLKQAQVALGGRRWEGFRGNEAVLLEPPVAGDRDNVYLNLQPNERNEQPPPLAWRWSDGAVVRSPERALKAASAVEGWLMWADGGKTFFTDRTNGATVELQGAGGTPLSLQLSPDRRTAYFTGRSPLGIPENPGFWDVQTGRLLARLEVGHEFAGFETTGRWAVTRDRGSEILLLDLRGGPPRRLKLPLELTPTPAFGPGGPITRSPLQVRSDGARLALPIHDAVHLWDVATNQPARQMRTSGHAGAVYALAQHAGQKWIASAGEDRVIHLWERDGNRLLKQFVGHTGPITALAFRPDGGALASASEDDSVVLWRPDGSRLWSSPLTGCGTLAFPSHGRFLACGTKDGRIVLLDPTTGKIQAEHATDGSEVLSLVFDRGGEVLASGTSKGQAAIWASRERDGFALLRAWATGKPITALAWLPTRNVLLTGGDALRFWELRSTEGAPPCVWTLGVPRAPVRALAVDASGRELIAADEGGQVVRFDLQTLSVGLRRWNLEVPGLLSASAEGKPSR